jgi:hypothetical protein
MTLSWDPWSSGLSMYRSLKGFVGNARGSEPLPQPGNSLVKKWEERLLGTAFPKPRNRIDGGSPRVKCSGEVLA